MERLGAIPSYYLRYFYAEREVLQEQSVIPPRAETVADIERRLLELYRDPALAEKPALLDQRGGAYYSEAAIQLLASLTTDSDDVQVVDVRNTGTLAGLADDDVVEMLARIRSSGPMPLRQDPLAPELLGLVAHVAADERLAATAARSGDMEAARLALLANPLVREWKLADGLLEGLVTSSTRPAVKPTRARTQRHGLGARRTGRAGGRRRGAGDGRPASRARAAKAVGARPRRWKLPASDRPRRLRRAPRGLLAEVRRPGLGCPGRRPPADTGKIMAAGADYPKNATRFTAASSNSCGPST